MGLFRVKDSIYYQLRVLNRLLDSRRIADELGQSHFKESAFINIENLLTTGTSLAEVVGAVEGALRVTDRSGELGQEENIAGRLFKLLPFSQHNLCELYLFQVYSILGYQL